MAQAKRHLLAHRDDIAGRGAGAIKHRQVLAPLRHGLFEFKGDVEVFDDPGLPATGDEDHLLDPRLARFVHRVLDQWAVYDREQLLGHHLGRGQEAGAKTGNGENGFPDRLGRHELPSLLASGCLMSRVPCLAP